MSYEGTCFAAGTPPACSLWPRRIGSRNLEPNLKLSCVVQIPNSTRPHTSHPPSLSALPIGPFQSAINDENEVCPPLPCDSTVPGLSWRVRRKLCLLVRLSRSRPPPPASSLPPGSLLLGSEANQYFLLPSSPTDSAVSGLLLILLLP